MFTSKHAGYYTAHPYHISIHLSYTNHHKYVISSCIIRRKVDAWFWPSWDVPIGRGGGWVSADCPRTGPDDIVMVPGRWDQER